MLYKKIQNKEVNIPTRWEDATWGQIKGLPTDSGVARVNWVEHFTGIENIDRKVVVADLMELSQAVSFCEVEPELGEDFSGVFQYEDKDYIITEQIHTVPAGIYFDFFKAVQASQKEDNAETLHESEIIAKIAIEHTIHGDDDYDYGRAMDRDIDSMNFVQVMKVIRFFLPDSMNLKAGIEANSPSQDTPTKKSKRGIWKYLRGMASI